MVAMNTLVMDAQTKHYIKSSTVQICIFRVVRVQCQTSVKRKEKCIHGTNTIFIHWPFSTFPLSSNSMQKDSAKTSSEQSWRKKSSIRPKWPLFFFLKKYDKKDIYILYFILKVQYQKAWSVIKQKSCFPCIFKSFDFISTGNDEKAEPIILPETYIHVNSIMGI